MADACQVCKGVPEGQQGRFHCQSTAQPGRQSPQRELRTPYWHRVHTGRELRELVHTQRMLASGNGQLTLALLHCDRAGEPTADVGLGRVKTPERRERVAHDNPFLTRADGATLANPFRQYWPNPDSCNAKKGRRRQRRFDKCCVVTMSSATWSSRMTALSPQSPQPGPAT